MNRRDVNPVPLDPRDCEQCGARGCVSARLVEQRFDYGSGENKVELTALVPAWQCSNCDETYFEGDADDIRHEVVCAHLERPSPKELKIFRAANGLSQEDLAGLTNIGIASIKRWETGEQIPSESLATYLKLVMHPGVLGMLRQHAEWTGRALKRPVFRTEFSPKAQDQAAIFVLRRPHPMRRVA